MTSQMLPTRWVSMGESKLAGEQAVGASLERHVIVRVAWVIGRIGRSFVDTMIRLARERDELRVVHDQHVMPTPAVYIAQMLWEARAGICGPDRCLSGIARAHEAQIGSKDRGVGRDPGRVGLSSEEAI